MERRIQPRMKKGGQREELWSAVDPRIRAAAERDAIRWKCSLSWIAHTALAAFYDIDIVRPSEAKRKRKSKLKRVAA
jgi:hypothetical protein